MASASAASPTTYLPSAWSDLPPELLGLVIARLPFPADRARLRAVCCGWHCAVRRHARQLPWLVLPDGSFCTVGDDGAYFPRGMNMMPGLPENATCVGSTDGWLALDCTDDALGRTDSICDQGQGRPVAFKEPSRDVRHKHAYLLHNPFSGETVPLPELDAVIGDASEVLEVRKVLMRSPTPDDVVAVVTSSSRCNVILFRPGRDRGTSSSVVTCNLGVFDVAFLGDWLYGITPEEELLAFRIGEDGDGGDPTITKIKRVIKRPVPDGEEDFRSWIDDDDSDHVGIVEEEEEQVQDQQQDDDDESSFNGDDLVSDGEVIEYDEDSPAYNGAKDMIVTTRRLVRSRGGELLMVRRQVQRPPISIPYIREIEVFKMDISRGSWVPVASNGGLAQDESLFVSGGGFSKSTLAYGDIQAGSIYSDDIDQVFDTRSSSFRPFRVPWWRACMFGGNRMTWIFPPELVV